MRWDGRGDEEEVGYCVLRNKESKYKDSSSGEDVNDDSFLEVLEQLVLTVTSHRPVAALSQGS